VDKRLELAISKLDHGSYSLTVQGFARRAVGAKSRETDRELFALMMDSGLPHRRITAGIPLDVWDIDVS
jgi:hypothetical protein